MSLKVIKISGTSMMPILKDGYAFIKQGVNDVRVGDMVLYSFMGNFYIHRVYKVRDNVIVISNDDDMEFHEVDRRFVLGKVKNFFNGYKGYIFGILARIFRKIKKVLYVNISKANLFNI